MKKIIKQYGILKKKWKKRYSFMLFTFFRKAFLKTPQGKYLLRKWSKAIIKRDKRCIVCGRSKPLEAHHLYDKSTYPYLAYRISNGVALCRKHHQNFHMWNGGNKASCTPQDLKLYIKKIKEKAMKG